MLPRPRAERQLRFHRGKRVSSPRVPSPELDSRSTAVPPAVHRATGCDGAQASKQAGGVERRAMRAPTGRTAGRKGSVETECARRCEVQQQQSTVEEYVAFDHSRGVWQTTTVSSTVLQPRAHSTLKFHHVNGRQSNAEAHSGKGADGCCGSHKACWNQLARLCPPERFYFGKINA